MTLNDYPKLRKAYESDILAKEQSCLDPGCQQSLYDIAFP